MASNLECTICLSSFSKPKILPCYHTFCEACLKDHASRSSDSSRFQCPLCRKNIQIPKGGVKSFTNNFYINEQLTSSSCGDDSGARPKTTKSSKRATCSRHGKIEDLFCEVCRLPVCSKCLVANHNQHKVSDLQEVTTKTAKQIKSLFDTLESESHEYEEFESSVTAMKSSIDSQTEKLCNEIESHADEICKEVTKISEKMTSEVKRQHSLKKDQLTELVSEVMKSKHPSKNSLDDVGENLLAMLDLKSSLECRLKDSSNKPNFTIPNQRLMVFINGTIEPGQLSSQVGKIKFDKIVEIRKSRALPKKPLIQSLRETFVFQFKLNYHNGVVFVGRDCLNESPFCPSEFEIRAYANFRRGFLKLDIVFVRVLLKLPLSMKMQLLNFQDPKDCFFSEGIVQSLDGVHVWENICHRNTLQDEFLNEDRVFVFKVTLEEITS